MSEVAPGTSSEFTEERVRAVLDAHRSERGGLLPVLHDIQGELGCIDERAVAMVACDLNLSQAEVFGVVTFYPDFRASPSGASVIRICRAEACQSMGAEALARHATESLGVGLGDTTADGSITLEQVFCLGNCALSPAVMVNEKLVGRVDSERFDALVARARARASGEPQP